MTVQQVKDCLKDIIVKNFDGQGNDYIVFDDGKQVISVSKFVSMFSQVEGLTCENLKSVISVESGWHKTFDDWKQKGYIE